MIPPKILLLQIMLLCISGPTWAQDGQLLKREPVMLPDSILPVHQGNPTYQAINESVDISSITYLSDGLKINGYLATPKEPGTYPVVVFNRGGNRDFGALNAVRATYILGRIASWGYVVAASNYRGGGGSEGMEEFGGKDVRDVHHLIPMLANMAEADTSRMAIYGYSRGGLMTYRVLAETCAFEAAIVGAGVTNSIRMIAQRPPMEEHVYAQLIPNYSNNKEAALKDRSPIFWADQLCKSTPIMLLHGSSDWRVSPEDAMDMVAELYRLKHPVRFHFYEGGDHGLSKYRELTSADIKAFLDHYVRDLNPLPDMEPHGN